MKTVWKNQVNRRSIIDVGRNEACPCGSKMKFKYCCLDKIARPILRRTGKTVEINVMEYLKKAMGKI
jgi:hypothetical protein